MAVRSNGGHLVLAVAFTGLLVMTGCAGHRWQRTESVVRQADLTVELEELRFEGEPVERFEHPAEIDFDQLVVALQSLQYETDFLIRGTKRVPVVAEETARPLARAIVAGLQQASASERVRFRLRTGSTSLFVLPSSTLTRGVAFVSEGGRFEIAFDQLHALPDIDETGASSERWGNPTGRPRSRGRLVYPEFARAGVNDQGGAMPLWASVDLDAVTPAALVERSDGDGENGANATSAEKPDLPRPAEPSPPEPITDAEVLAQLRLLEKLREDGVITAEEHDRRRKQILAAPKAGDGS